MIDSSPQAFRAEEMNTVKVRYIHSPKKNNTKKTCEKEERFCSKYTSLFMLFHTLEASMNNSNLQSL